MTINMLMNIMLFLSLICTVYLFYKLYKQPKVYLSTVDYLKLMITGFISFIADTLGLGSFAVNIALSKLLNTFSDEELPAMNNGAQVIPGTIESLLFMQMVNVDLKTLLTLVIGTCIGGLLGGMVVSHLSKQAIRLAMMGCFTLIIGLLLANEFNIVPLGGTLTELNGGPLIIGFFAMIICGALTSVGIGLFVLVQSVLFLLHISPLAAFPIMTTAGAMQQPLTTLVFLQQDKIPLKRTLILSLSGCLGVFFAVSIFAHLTVSGLHSLLILIVLFNLYNVSKNYYQNRKISCKNLLPQT